MGGSRAARLGTRRVPLHIRGAYDAQRFPAGKRLLHKVKELVDIRCRDRLTA
jgi:hypothetical protein